MKLIPYQIMPNKDGPTKKQDYLFKMIIIGNSGVGKSCLMHRVTTNEFSEDHEVTVGVEFGSLLVKMDETVLKLQIWDTAGQESFQSITKIFYRGAHCVFLTYDVTREDTFVNLNEWLKEIKQHASEDVRVYLIGNKSEMEEQREVTFQRALEFANEYKLHKVFETSAKTGYNVEEVFATVAKELYMQVKREADLAAKAEEATKK